MSSKATLQSFPAGHGPCEESLKRARTETHSTDVAELLVAEVENRSRAESADSLALADLADLAEVAYGAEDLMSELEELTTEDANAAGTKMRRRASNVLLPHSGAPPLSYGSPGKDRRFQTRKVLSNADEGLPGVPGRHYSGKDHAGR